VHHTKSLLSFFILLFITGCGRGSSFDLPPANAETPDQDAQQSGGDDGDLIQS
jgi:predicted small lipoprotein YifL